MQAITVHQPWGHLMFEHDKRIENRTWLPPKALLGKRIAIHVASRLPDPRNRTMFDLVLPLETLPRSAIIGTAVVRGALDTRHGKHEVHGHVTSAHVRAMMRNRWWNGPVGWLLDDLVRCTPIKCGGAQGIWNVSDVDARRVAEHSERSWSALMGTSTGA